MPEDNERDNELEQFDEQGQETPEPVYISELRRRWNELST